MENLNKLLQKAQKVADARKKEFIELEKIAPEVLEKTCEAIKELGFVSINFGFKIHRDQKLFRTYHEEEYYFSLNNDSTFSIGKDAELNEEGFLDIIFEEENIPVREMKWYRLGLLTLLKSLERNLVSMIEKRENQIKEIQDIKNHYSK